MLQGIYGGNAFNNKNYLTFDLDLVWSGARDVKKREKKNRAITKKKKNDNNNKKSSKRFQNKL